MKLAAILVSVIALAACNTGRAREGVEAQPSGEGNQRSFAVTDFNSVGLDGHHNVVVAVGPAVSVRAEGPSDSLDELDIRIDKGRLRIGNKDDGRMFGRNEKPSVTVYVTMPTLAAAAIGGSGDMRIDKVEGGKFDAAIGGSGNMTVGTAQVGEANLAIAGSGTLTVAGTARKSNVSIAGSGDVDAGGLATESADVSIAGSGDASIRASSAANISIVGSGDVTVAGGAKCAVNRVGSGDVRCGA